MLNTGEGISLKTLATEFHFFSFIHIQMFTLITQFSSVREIKDTLMPDFTSNYASAIPV